MKKPTKRADASAPQTVTRFIKAHNRKSAVQIDFTDQQFLAHAGFAAFANFLQWRLMGRKCWADCFPNAHQPERLQRWRIWRWVLSPAMQRGLGSSVRWLDLRQQDPACRS